MSRPIGRHSADVLDGGPKMGHAHEHWTMNAQASQERQNENAHTIMTQMVMLSDTDLVGKNTMLLLESWESSERVTWKVRTRRRSD